MAKNNETRRNGYIYSPGTAQGFLRMQRQGIPRPVFSIENRLKTLLERKYRRMVRLLISDFKAAAEQSGITSAQLTQDAEPDALKSLKEFLSVMGVEEQKAKELLEGSNFKTLLNITALNLAEKWKSGTLEDSALREELGKILKANQDDYSERLKKDASKQMRDVLEHFSIDKQKLYETSLEDIRRLYLDNALERVFAEEEFLKHHFLEMIDNYVSGKSDKLEISNVISDLYKSTSRMAQFFARDQLARLNKATTLATYNNAGVTKVKWVTTHDVRVRPSHKALDGKIFNVNDLPKEIDDYNCRCGLIPVEWQN